MPWEIQAINYTHMNTISLNKIVFITDIQNWSTSLKNLLNYIKIMIEFTHQ